MRLITTTVLILLLSQLAVACWMLPTPPTKIEGSTIVGQFSYEGKALRASRVELRGANGRLISRSATDENGRYHFAIRAGGLYQITMLNPSYESFVIDLLITTKQQQTLNVNFFGDYCYTIQVGST